ncbi:MAG: hypothetical protein K0R17_1917 [Rariglobus sp.]|jgi:hypothetical protein|nr:hypothetical protein [Rariglobus sp.]
MRPALPLLLVLSLVFPFGLHAQDASQVDASKRNTQLAATPESADTPVSPGREANQRTFFRNDHVQDQRFSAPDTITRKEAAVGDRRAPIDVTETHEKEIVDRKDFPKPEVRDRKMNSHNGEKAYIQPEGDMVNKYDMVSKYQQGMADADTAAARRSAKFTKRPSFEKLNRFIFKRNGPGTPDGQPMVTPAAGGPAPASQDTYTKYRVEWKRLDGTKIN